LPAYGVEFGRIDTVAMAKACGVDALRTADPVELAHAARQAIDRRRGVVIAVPICDADYPSLF
jgi:thiamine pyrophosphate-dependent acetolactate synthase large subunit-like protein